LRPVKIHNRYYNVPESWNELTPPQLVKAMKVIYSDMDNAAKLFKLFQIITGMNQWRFFWAPITEICDAIHLAVFMVQPADLTKSILVKFRGRVGPADDFDNITGAEYAHTEYFFQQYLETKDPARLNELVGVLYRPARRGYDHTINPAGDAREPFNSRIIGHYSKCVCGWPDPVKKAVLTWYDSCRRNLMANNPRVFGGGQGVEPLHGIWSIMRGIAEKGNHGQFKDVELMPIKEIMMELNEISAEDDRIRQLQPPQTQTV
jgi:hypothetical protein